MNKLRDFTLHNIHLRHYYYIFLFIYVVHVSVKWKKVQRKPNLLVNLNEMLNG